MVGLVRSRASSAIWARAAADNPLGPLRIVKQWQGEIEGRPVVERTTFYATV
jgi:hypothetical protein